MFGGVRNKSETQELPPMIMTIYNIIIISNTIYTFSF